jgi:hypothetical protein
MDFAQCMSAMISDLIEDKINHRIGNAVCNAAGKLLKLHELRHKYGTVDASGNRILELAPKAG